MNYDFLWDNDTVKGTAQTRPLEPCQPVIIQ